ncbi:MAG: M23 family metallopeptidase [Campylobacterales bacterium]
MRHHYNPRKKQRFKLYLSLAIVAAAVLYVTFSPHFEREAPAVKLAKPLYWNLIEPMPIELNDNIGLKSYRVTMTIGENRTVLIEGSAEGNQSLTLGVRHPPVRTLPEGAAKLEIEVTDTSLWRFFQGNRTLHVSDLILDRHNPTVNLIGHSYGIAPGGSAAVVFEAHDEHLKTLHVVTKNGASFEAAPFYKEGFYVALIARDLLDRDFVAHVLATDEAGNQTRVRVPLFLKEVRYRQSNITLSEMFLKGKIDDLHYQFDAQGRDKSLSGVEKFLFVNEVLRRANDELVATRTQGVLNEGVKEFAIEPFAPLPNGAVVAHFGDRRDFYYDKKRISHSYHLGIDLASVKEAVVYSTNPGTVVFVGDNGIYGNMPIVHHGLGLYSVYGHSTRVDVKEGQKIGPKAALGTTGVSGLALGDHLHFELRVQGIAVTPLEWMDRAWIKTNITKVMEDAKNIIKGREG